MAEHRRLFFQHMLQTLLGFVREGHVSGRGAHLAGAGRVRQVLDDFFDIVRFGSTSMSMRLVFDVSLRSTRENAPLWNEIYLPPALVLARDLERTAERGGAGSAAARERSSRIIVGQLPTREMMSLLMERAAVIAVLSVNESWELDEVDGRSAWFLHERGLVRCSFLLFASILVCLSILLFAHLSFVARAGARADRSRRLRRHGGAGCAAARGGVHRSAARARRPHARAAPAAPSVCSRREGACAFARSCAGGGGGSTPLGESRVRALQSRQRKKRDDGDGVAHEKRAPSGKPDASRRVRCVAPVALRPQRSGGTSACTALTHTRTTHTHAHTRARAHAPPPPTVCGCRYEIVVAHRPHINPDTLWSHTKVKEAHEYYLRSVLGRRLDDAAKEWVDALVMGTIWSGSPYMRARDAVCAAYGGAKRAKELKRECEHAPILTTGATSWRADEVRELRRAASFIIFFFIYRFILREDSSQFDSLPLTSLTIHLAHLKVRELRRAASEQTKMVRSAYLEHFAAIGAVAACARLHSGGAG